MMGNWLEKGPGRGPDRVAAQLFRRYAGLGLIKATVETCRSNFGALG